MKVTEKLITPNGITQRKAFAERLEGFGREQKMVLSGAPRVETESDVIKGYRITIRENVDLVEVDDAMSFIKSKGIMIVPLLSAGGIRVKIIEGLALGKAIISTSLGAEGINCTNGKDILIADNKREWIEAIEKVLQPKVIKELGHNGRLLAERDFNNKAIVKNLIGFYKLLKKNDSK